MTREQIMAMSAAQLRLAIAEAKGWQRKFGMMDKASRAPHEYFVKPDGSLSLCLPTWSYDIAAAWELEEELTERKDRYKYTQYLIRIVGEDERDTFDVQQWQLIHATPIQRCRAWLMWKSKATK